MTEDENCIQIIFFFFMRPHRSLDIVWGPAMGFRSSREETLAGESIFCQTASPPETPWVPIGWLVFAKSA